MCFLVLSSLIVVNLGGFDLGPTFENELFAGICRIPLPSLPPCRLCICAPCVPFLEEASRDSGSVAAIQKPLDPEGPR